MSRRKRGWLRVCDNGIARDEWDEPVDRAIWEAFLEDLETQAAAWERDVLAELKKNTTDEDEAKTSPKKAGVLRTLSDATEPW